MAAGIITGCDGHFQCTLLEGSLCVVSIPPEMIPSAAWWIVRQYVMSPLSLGRNAFSSVLMDDDGLSLVCSPEELSMLQSLNLFDLKVSSQRWKALVIQIIGSVTQFPGAVHHLANSLSSRGLSILHISTFEREIFLVQEHDMEIACDVLQMATASDGFVPIPENEPSLSDGDKISNGFTLGAIPGYVMLAKLREDSEFLRCSDVLLRLLLFDERYNPIEKRISTEKLSLSSSSSSSLPVVDTPSSSPSLDSTTNGTGIDIYKKLKATYMWGIWRCQDEITLLLDESDIIRFPEDALIVSPQRWRVVKLCGRPIAFDETGIVSAMSRVESDIPTLNISTATTNCTLVPEERLSQTLEILSKSLRCNVQE